MVGHVVVQVIGQGSSVMWCKACGIRDPVGLPLRFEDFAVRVQTWTERERDHMSRAIENYLTERDRLRQAIRHWAVGPHAQWCTTRAECPCDCGAADEFEARAIARRLVGLEVEP